MTVILYAGVLMSLLAFGCFAAVSNAAAEDMVKKIVVFHEEVGEDAIDAFAGEWASAGAMVVMKLPFINGLVLSVPTSIDTKAISNDPRVEYVEEDRGVELR